MVVHSVDWLAYHLVALTVALTVAMMADGLVVLSVDEMVET